MLKNAQYIYDNIIIADEVNTTKKYCAKAQVGVDLSIKKPMKIVSMGAVLKDKTYAPDYEDINKVKVTIPGKNGESIETDWGWKLKRGTYILVLNEGCKFGPNDTGYIILRSSLNRGGCSVVSAVWDPGYHSISGEIINPMTIRLTVDADEIFIEENARVAQLLVFENEDTNVYAGQWLGGLTKSNLT